MNKNDQRFLKTEALIRSHFLEMMKTTKYSDITVSDFCKDILISKNTFYLHYENKDALYNGIVDDLLKELENGYINIISDAAENTSENHKKCFCHTVDFINEHYDIFHAFFAQDYEINFSRRFTNAFKKLTKNWTELHLISKADAAEFNLLSNYIHAGCVSFLKCWVLEEYDEDIEHIKEMLIDIMIDASERISNVRPR